MTSDGGTGCVAQPARNINAQQKKIPAGLNTRQLCAMKNGTQAVSSFWIRKLRQPRHAGMLGGARNFAERLDTATGFWKTVIA